jgi:uncharacterized membrane protein YraQ (UPF0718 family)
MTTLSQQETLTQLLWVQVVLLEQMVHKLMETQVVIATLLAVALQEVQAVSVVSLVVQEERVVLMVQLAHLLVVLAVQVAQVEQHY